MLIGICDDTQADIDKLHDWLVAHDPKHELSIQMFHSGEELLESMVRGPSLDILFLDCKMNRLSGIETAKRIREIDRMLVLILVTQFAHYALTGYDVGAFAFVPKDDFDAHIETAWERAHSYASVLGTHVINLDGTDGVRRYRLRDLMYFESDRNRVYAHLQEGEPYAISRKLKDIEMESAASAFVRVHESFLVNSMHILNITKSTVALSNGETLSVSRSRAKAAMEKFTNAMFEVIPWPNV